MKKIIALFVFAVLLVSCNSHKKYSDFDYSFSRSGGYAPTYENFLIKGNNAHYSFEGQGKNIKKDFKVTNEEIGRIEKALTDNKFRTIREDLKKVYDNVTTSINVKVGNNSGSKNDGSFIMENDRQRWENIVNTFRQLIDSKIGSTAETK
ncbi:hypothetical protein MTP09_10135 [Chryseobacterium suipulveris]|uniref:Lipoprotein n=1 Tax=Chryseobacterium suipulveris TaxID=2929800 RepID=A0ABY4BN07_9FLAO|nr:hypothetical protein [Chryseobacterium suipulveris]UOE40269.1 hypothetical protein MTP09_10135 [Chryseobacterium suipulveris]